MTSDRMRLGPTVRSARLLAILIGCVVIHPCLADVDPPIILDGNFDDWGLRSQQPEFVLESVEGGDGRSVVVSMVRTRSKLYLNVRFPDVVALQGSDSITLYLDTDVREETGASFQGAGIEFKWNFGEMTGATFKTDISAELRQHNVDLLAAPTFRSKQFEIELGNLVTDSNGETVNLLDSTVRVLVSGPDGNLLKAQSSAEYSILMSPPTTKDESPLPIDLARSDATDIRVMTFNVKEDGIKSAVRQDAIARLIRSIDADIVALQEMVQTTDVELESYFSGLSDGHPQTWHARKFLADDSLYNQILISRFPILFDVDIRGSARGKFNGAVVLGLGPPRNEKVLVVALNPPCCDADERRQVEVDSIMATLREFMKNPVEWGGHVNMPIILMGDSDFVGDPRQLHTILSGDISDELRFGEDFAPDWDGSRLTDSAALHTHSRHRFTYIDAEQAYLPGLLDYVIYADSALSLEKSFVVFTPEMPNEYLKISGLKKTDSTVASDHLPVVADFQLIRN